ncbi:MAG: preprotein translocase subunit SecY [Kiritimatiellae bacterium]|nr:preprotein translocase subunit SecY [Kiritimatiellia bacterium]
MAMFKGFSNAFRIPELRKKILITLGIVAVCRLVSQIPTPGVDWQALHRAIEHIRETSGGGGLFDWFDIFTGGALGQCAIGFLSIWPYISAQIVIQLLSSVIPSLEKLKKEGESGRQQLAQITRYLTIVLCVVQSWSIATALSHPTMLGINEQIVVNPGLGFQLMTVIGMTSAALFVMWLADQITTFGIGNGGSLIIMINITSRLPEAIMSAWQRYFGANGLDAIKSPVELALLLLFGFGVVMGTVMLTQGVRKVTIHATRRSIAGGNSYGMQQTYMPLRVNYTGVMPIIFAQPLLQIPAMLLMKIPSDKTGFLGALRSFGMQLGDMGSATHLVIYAAVIMFFAFFWVATQFNAVDISENLKKDGSYVPGIRPGRATAEYLDAVMTRITLIGGTGLLIVALLPQVLNGMMQVPWAIASFFGGTSLLIIVGVALDTLRIMESHLLVRKYDGFLRHGSLRGRGGM